MNVVVATSMEGCPRAPAEQAKALTQSYCGRVSTADELMGLVLGVRRVVRRRLRAQMPGPALRGAQVELLQLVEEEPGVGVAAAARSPHVGGNTVSTLVNQLAEAGMLYREVDPADRRAARLTLTAAARARLARWRAARSLLVAEAVGRLSAHDVAALEAALPALKNLVRELEE
jgi:DNA-binding MarR family transcriptional regulator